MTTTESENLETARLYLRAIEDRVSFHELASFFTPDVVQREYPNQFVRQGAERDLQQLREAAERDVTSLHRSTMRFVTPLRTETGWLSR